MMRWMMVLLLCSSSAWAEQKLFEHGVSSGQALQQPQTMTAWLLQQQRNTGAAPRSELPTPLYVESQNRLVESFKQPIPESLTDSANSRRKSD